MQVELWQLVYTLSDALDLVGVDDRYHGKRVAVMAAAVGEELGWAVRATQIGRAHV